MQDEKENVSLNDLLNEQDGNFSLQKYFSSFRKIKNNLKDGTIEDLLICTNVDLADSLKDSMNTLTQADLILPKSDSKKSAHYQVKPKDKTIKEKLYPVLKKTSDTLTLARTLAKCVFEDKKIEARGLFKHYHLALVNDNIIDAKNKKLHPDFILGKTSTPKKKKQTPLSKEVATFRAAFVAKAKELLKTNSEKDVWAEAQNKALLLSGTIGTSNDTSLPSTLPKEEKISDKEITEFLGLLVFAVNQPNEIELGQMIEKNISEDLNLVDNSFVASEFQKQMLDWMKDKEGRFITEKEGTAFFQAANRKLADLILLGPSLEYQVRLEESGLIFKAPDSLNKFLNSKNKVLHLTTTQSTELTAIKTCQLVKASPQYAAENSRLFQTLSVFLRLEKKLLDAYRNTNSHYLLVIECDVNPSETQAKKLCTDILKILQDNYKKKIILITKGKNNFSKLFEHHQYYQSIKDSEQHFSGLTGEAQKRILDKKMQHQGQSFSLNTVISKEEALSMISEEDFLELASPGNLSFHNTLYALPEFDQSSYIPRTFQRQLTIKRSCLQSMAPCTFVMSGISKAELSTLKAPKDAKISLYSELNTTDKEPPRFILLSDHADKEFTELVKCYPQSRIHHLHIDDKIIVWKNSHGSMADLRQYILKEETEEKEFFQTSRFMIIAAEPGMGKSTFMTQLAHEQQEKVPTHCTIKLNLIDHKDTWAKSKLTGLDAAIRCLSDLMDYRGFSRKLFRHLLTNTHKVNLFLDGFDELTTEEQATVVDLLKVLFRDTQITLVVSTRFHLRENLEDALSSLAYTLKDLSTEEQETYLVKFWLRNTSEDFKKKHQKTLSTYSKQLLTLFSTSIQSDGRDFMGIPLQARMLAEAFSDGAMEYCQDHAAKSLPETLNILKLYQRFIQQKYIIYFREKVKLGETASTELKEMITLTLNKVLQALAIDLLFTKDADNFNDPTEKDRYPEEIKRLGLIQSIDTHCSFIHRTFAEYLASTFFVRALASKTDDPSYGIVKSCLTREIFKDKHQVIRQFIAWQVQDSTEDYLKTHWRDICAYDLISSQQSKDKHAIHINYESNMLAKNPETELSDLLKTLTSIKPKADDWDERKKFLNDCFIAIEKSQHSEEIDQALTGLISLANKTNYNIQKNHIVSKLEDLIQHYLSCCFAQYPQGKEPPINYELLKSCTTITPFPAPSYHSETYETFVTTIISQLKNKTTVYNELNKLRENSPKITTKLMKDLSKAQLLFFRINRSIFNNSGFSLLTKHYKTYSKDEDFMSLLLQIDSSAQESSKQFLIEKKELSWLSKLLCKFQNIAWTDKDSQSIYPNQKLHWLERDGVEFARKSMALTRNMAAAFCNILKADNINGFHTGYANNIFMQFILPALSEIGTSNALKRIDLLAFIGMIDQFLKFGQEHSICYSVNGYHLNTLLNLIQQLMNQSNITIASLKASINCLITLSIATTLKLIETTQGLLILNPSNEFEHTLPLKDKLLIITLIKSKLEKSDTTFEEDCKQLVIKKISASSCLTTAGLFKAPPQPGEQAVLESPMKTRKDKPGHSVTLLNLDLAMTNTQINHHRSTKSF